MSDQVRLIHESLLELHQFGRFSPDTLERLTESHAELYGDEDQADEDQADEVPTGSAREVLDWVDEDPERAQLALDAEAERDRPRKTLTADLTAVIDADQEV